jgi:hypothetical protein
LSEVKDVMAWVSLLDQEVAWLVLFFTQWHDLSKLDWGTWSGVLSEMNSMSVDNDVLSKIGFACKSNIMWW